MQSNASTTILCVLVWGYQYFLKWHILLFFFTSVYEHSENTNLKKEKKENEPLFTCGIYSYSVISVFQKIFSKIEPGSMKPLRYISNAFGFINNLKCGMFL